MESKKFQTVSEYISSQPAEVKSKLKELRAAIKKAAPMAEEKIGYNMPGYYLNGPLVYFAVHSSHIGLYALPKTNEAFKDKLSAYETSKGAIKFPLDKKLPLSLITQIVKFRIKENLEKASIKKAKAKPRKKVIQK